MKFIKKYWKYILAFLLFLIPFLLGIFGGKPLTTFFDLVYGFILNIYMHSFMVSMLVAYIIMLVMMIALYFKNKRSVGLFRYVTYFSVINIFMILVYALAFLITIVLSRFTIYFNIFGFFESLSFISAKNFGNFYTFIVGITIIVLLGIKFFKRMNSVEREVNVYLMEKLDKQKLEKKKLPYFGNLDEYYNDLVTGMESEFKTLDHPSMEEMNVYFPEVRLSLDEKQKFLKDVEKNLEDSINEKLKEEGIKKLDVVNSTYDYYENNDGKLKDLTLKYELASKLKYTLYNHLKETMKPITLFNNLYTNGLSEEKNPETLNNRLDEVMIQKSILNHYGIEVENKYLESSVYFNTVISQINELFMKLYNDKNSFLKSNKVAKEYADFDKSSVIIRNINIIDELVIDSRMLIFSPKGIYSVENLKFKDVSTVEISEAGEWTVTNYDGSKNVLRDIMVQTKNHIAMEKNHLNKQLVNNNLSLSEDITIKPLVIIHNENVDIINNSDIIVVKEHEYVPYIQGLKDSINEKDLEIVENIFAGDKNITHEYNQVDYVKYFEFIIDAYFRYIDELKYIASKLEYVIDVLTKENVISDNYLNTVKDTKALYYSYDYMMYLAHQKHYKDNESKEFDNSLNKLD